MIDIAHHDAFTTRYAHLARIGVSVGDQVSSGQEIGASGCSGMCTGPHLHFELHKNGTPVNPANLLP